MSIEASWRLQQGNAFSAFGGQVDAKEARISTPLLRQSGGDVAIQPHLTLREDR
jgi:hypothetical protein